MEGKVHGSGHGHGDASGSVVGFIMMSLVFLVASAAYIIWRNYIIGRRFSADWLKEFGPNSEAVIGFGPNKKRPDGKDEETGLYYGQAPDNSQRDAS
jgi:hypothetical protein